MNRNDGWTRRKFVGAGATGIALVGASDFLLGCANVAKKPSGEGGLKYFSQFGVDERMMREALAAALSRGGDYADIFFQHQVGNDYVLEDGEVNRAFTTVQLGVGDICL